MPNLTESLLQESLPASPTRESWRPLPASLQPWLTALSAKPLAGERPREGSVVANILSSLLALAIGVALNAAATIRGGACWLMVIPGLVLALHGFRKLALNAFHEASHGAVSRTPWINDAWGVLIGVLLLSQHFRSYQRAHLEDHHAARSHMTLDDPTADLLIRWVGLRAGMSVPAMWRRLGLQLISPWFHLRMLGDRLVSYYKGASVTHRALSLLYAATLAGAGATWGWDVLLVAWVLPLTLPYNAALVIRACVEHTFRPAEGELPGRRGRAVIAGLSHSVFFGSPAPRPGLTPLRRLAAWTWWWVRMVGYHLPARLMFVPGEAATHDWHSRYPHKLDWPSYAYARQRDLEAGCPGWPWTYTEVWGLHGAMNLVFRSLSLADPREYDPARKRNKAREEAKIMLSRGV
jgi:fatty acid desaturase